jgi:hypothetical protein
MKKIFIIALLLNSVFLYGQFLCEDYKNCTVEILQSICNRILSTSDSLLLRFEYVGFDNVFKVPLNKKNISEKIIFFSLFPDNFLEFNDLYGWNKDSNSPHVLYDVSYEHINLFGKSYFIIPKEKYYSKLIEISIGGHWDDDAIGLFQKIVRDAFIENMEIAIKILDTYKDYDISNFWFFFYDCAHYDHPEQKKFYKKIREEVNKINTHVYEIMQNTYNTAYKESIEKK